MAQHYRDTRLTTVTRLKSFADPKSDLWTDATMDALLGRCVVEASGIISDWCERRFEGRIHTAYLDGKGLASMWLAHWPVAQPEPTLQINFTSGGTYRLSQGDTITGANSGATATVCWISWLSSGRWDAGDAAGTLYLADQTGGKFEAEELDVTLQGETSVATIAGDSSASAEFGIWIDASRDFAAADKLTEERDGVSGDYLIYPEEEGRGRLEAIGMYDLGSPGKWTKGRRNIKIVLPLGWDEAPAPVEEAVQRVSLKLYEQATILTHGAESVDLAPSGGTARPGERKRLPGDVEGLLWAYKRELT